MKTITREEMVSNLDEILQRASGGESIEVTMDGEVVANLVPPQLNPFPGLNVQLATSRDGFKHIQRVKLDVTTQEILDELREDII